MTILFMFLAFGNSCSHNVLECNEDEDGKKGKIRDGLGWSGDRYRDNSCSV